MHISIEEIAKIFSASLNKTFFFFLKMRFVNEVKRKNKVIDMWYVSLCLTPNIQIHICRSKIVRNWLKHTQNLEY